MSGVSQQVRQSVAEALYQLDQGNTNRTQATALVLSLLDLELEKAQAMPDAAQLLEDGTQEVLERLAAGGCSVDEAKGFMDGRAEVLRAQYAEQYAGTLLDTFASMAQVPTSFEGVMPEALAKVVMGEDPPPVADALARFTWFCEAEGRVRYIKANAMMEAREI